MGHGLEIKELGRSASTVWFGLSGEITEENDLQSMIDKSQGLHVLDLDLGGVVRINSIGVRDWVKFALALQSSGRTLVLQKCSVPIVQQLNAIAGFKGNGIVASVFAPYYCRHCDTQSRRLIELSNTQALPDLEAAMNCPDCGKLMEFDDIAQSYLGFWQA
jgi:eukaryotic-like serine/threonine-protein kinase